MLRPHFIQKIVYYAAKKDFLAYLPTNGRLVKPEVIDRLVDGTLAPCFPMYSATCDWGTVGNPKFEKHYFSTLNHIISYVYNNGRVICWILRQPRNGFTSASGTVE